MRQEKSNRKVFVLNCGSSSVKFAVIIPETGKKILSGLVERIGESESSLSYVDETEKKQIVLSCASHQEALRAIVGLLKEKNYSEGTFCAIGHRVVHGGEIFRHSVLIDEGVLEKIAILASLAPLHNPVNKIGIDIARKLFPNIQHVAVFDTAFHQSMPEKAFFYAVPYEWYEQHAIRKYGFHGTSHHFVSMKAAELLKIPYDVAQLITVHLGNGCSACAVKKGRSVDTTMGFTPLEGLVMGTRSGDIDPSIIQYLQETQNISVAKIFSDLNTRSGLLGLSGISNDMRLLIEKAHAQNARAILAIAIFCYRLAKGIASLYAALDKVDALVFTGGIGENASMVRAQTLFYLKSLGYAVNDLKNQSHGKEFLGIISENNTCVAMVVPTDEEWMIARETIRRI